MDAFVPQVNALRGAVFTLLRRHFKSDVRHNDAALRRAMINRHSWDHMRTVANGAYNLALRVYDGPWEDVVAMKLPTDLHDVGYDFPNGVDPESLCKEEHRAHAERGAEKVVSKLRQLQEQGILQREFPWWTEKHMQIASDSIRFHSNGSEAAKLDDSAQSLLVLLPRLLDKLDITDARVYPEHLQLFSRVPFVRMGHIQQLVQQKARWLLQRPTQRRHRSTQEEVFEKLGAFEYGFVHRLVPHAITDQRLLLHEATGMLEMQYAAFPSRVEDLLGVSYGPEEHSAHFDLAYGRSMQNAAQVAARIQRSLVDEESAAPALRVNLQYEDGSTVIKDYAGATPRKVAVTHGAA